MNRYNSISTKATLVLIVSLFIAMAFTILPLRRWAGPAAQPTAASANGRSGPLYSSGPVTSWRDHASVPVRVAQEAAASDEAFLYIIGGQSGANNVHQLIGNVQRYNPTTDSWTQLQGIGTGVAATGACYMHSKIYLPGGVTSSGSDDHMRIYDAIANTWSVGPSYGITFLNGAVVCSPSDNKVYILGGADSSGSDSRLRIYSAATNTWLSDGATLPVPRDYPMAGLLAGGKIIVAGGVGSALADTNIYNIATNTWSSAAPLNQIRYMAASGVGLDGKFYIAGGNGGSAFALPSVAVYDPQTNSWSQTDDLLQAANVTAGGFVGTTFYAIGGESNESSPSCSQFLICNYNQTLDIAGR